MTEKHFFESLLFVFAFGGNIRDYVSELAWKFLIKRKTKNEFRAYESHVDIWMGILYGVNDGTTTGNIFTEAEGKQICFEIRKFHH